MPVVTAQATSVVAGRGQRGRTVLEIQYTMAAHSSEPPCLVTGGGRPSGSRRSARPAVMVPAIRKRDTGIERAEGRSAIAFWQDQAEDSPALERPVRVQRQRAAMPTEQ